MATPTIGGNPDPAQIANTTNSVIRDVQAMQDVQVFKDDTGTRRVLMGRGPSGFYGLKVSQTGNDVYDATDDELVFNSDNNLFKIVDSGTSTGTVSDSAQSLVITIPHGLSSIPAVIAYAQFPAITSIGSFTAEPPYGGGYTSMPYTQQFYFSAGSDWYPWLTLSYEMDATNLYLRAYRHITGTGAGTDTISFRYYILQETAN